MGTKADRRIVGSRLGALLLPCLAAALLWPAPPAHAEGAPATDIVYLLDVSGSMSRRIGHAKAMLSENLDRIVQPRAQIAVVFFGDGVHRPRKFVIPEDLSRARTARAAIRSVIAQARAADTHTNLYDALEAGLEILREFQERRPSHARHVILVTDGKNQPDRARDVTAEGIFERFDRTDFRKGRDWFLWYAHYGEADAKLARAIEGSGAGKVVSLDEIDVRWAYTTVDPTTLNLRDRGPGAFSAAVAVVLRSDPGAVGSEVAFSLAEETVPEGMSLALEPARVRIRGTAQEVALTLSGDASRPGDYDGIAIDVRGEPERLHWVQTPRLHVLLRVPGPRVDLGASELALGRLRVGGEAEGVLKVIPNGDARRIKPNLAVEVAGAPEGFAITARAPEPTLDETRDVLVSVRAGDSVRPGEYEAEIRLSAGDVPVAPRRVPVRFSVAGGRVLAGSDLLDLRTIWDSGEIALALSPDAEAAAFAPEVVVEAVDAPPGVTVQVDPPALTLSERGRTTIRVDVEPGVEPGDYAATLRLRGPDGVRVEPETVEVRFTVGPREAIRLPAVVDLGEVRESDPAPLKATIRVGGGPYHHGRTVFFESRDESGFFPPSVRLGEEGAELDIALEGVAGAAPGEHERVVDAFVEGPDGPERVGSMLLRWRVLDTFLRVEGVRCPGLRVGDCELEATLALHASPDLAGRRVTFLLEPQDAPDGMRVELARTEAVLSGGLQQVALPLRVSAARAGVASAILRFRVDDAAGLQAEELAAPVALDVERATLAAALEGAPSPVTEAVRMRVLLEGAGLPHGARAFLTVRRNGLPGEYRVACPDRVDLLADGTTLADVTFEPGDDAPPGSWSPEILVHAPPGVAVEPSALGFRVAVPTFWAKHGDTVLASAGGLAVLLLAALVLWIRVRGPALEGYLAVSVEGVEVVGEELEPRGARSVTLGTGKGADLPFAMPADEPFSAALHTSKRSLFDREPRVRLDVLRGLDPAATIRCGRGPWEPFDGSAEVFDETHVRNGPVTISYTNLSLPVPGDEEDESPVAAGPRPGHAGDLL